MRHRTARGLLVAVLVFGMAIGSTTTALAAIVDRVHYSFSDSFTDEWCGLDIQVEVEGRGVFMIRADKPGSSAFFASNTYQYREVVTNLDTGEWLVVRGNGSFREVRATHVEGNVYRFRAHEAGQPFAIVDRNGRTVYRDRGLLVFDTLFDTLGDDQPGGVELSFEEVVARGYPGYLDDICPLVHDLIG